MAETESPSTASQPNVTYTARRRSSLTRPLALALLAMIGVALYLAWPEIMAWRGVPSTTISLAPTKTPATPAPPPEASAPVPSSEAPAPEEVELAALRARLEALEQATTTRVPPATPADIAIAEQLTDFSARLEAIERRPAGEGDSAAMARDAELGAHLANLEKRLAAAEAASAAIGELGAVLQDTYNQTKTLTQRLEGVEHRAADDVRLVALASAKAALSAAARDGAALAHELADLRALLPDATPIAAPLDELGRFTEHGALNYETLRARFPNLAREVVRAAAKPDDDAGWVDQTIARLGSIVTIRKTSGELAPGSLDERLVRAERALAESNGAAALDALDTLKGGEALEVFRDELKRRIALDDAVRAVDRHITGLIAARIVPASASATQ